jgi:hypothetical protein
MIVLPTIVCPLSWMQGHAGFPYSGGHDDDVRTSANASSEAAKSTWQLPDEYVHSSSALQATSSVIAVHFAML